MSFVRRLAARRHSALPSPPMPAAHKPPVIAPSPPPKPIGAPLERFLAEGRGLAQIDQALLNGLELAARQGRFDAFRFSTPSAADQLRPLTDSQRALWRRPQTMTHLRFHDDGEARFAQKVQDAAKLGALLHEQLLAKFGAPQVLDARRKALLAQLDRGPGRGPRRKLKGLSVKIQLLRWSAQLCSLHPDRVTPERLIALAEPLRKCAKQLWDRSLVDHLLATLRLDDLQYEQVITNDGPDLWTTVRLSTTDCLKWPGNGGEALAYAVDANKRMIVTRNAQNEARRAVLRLVERQDAGHRGAPLLLLERSYPRRATREEKQRLIEHALRRAQQMGVPFAMASEYYWDASQTDRFHAEPETDMNKVLGLLQERYQCATKLAELSLLTRAGNTQEEYLDSDPVHRHNRGRPSVRRWSAHHRGDARVFENEFFLFEPFRTPQERR